MKLHSSNALINTAALARWFGCPAILSRFNGFQPVYSGAPIKAVKTAVTGPDAVCTPLKRGVNEISSRGMRLVGRLPAAALAFAAFAPSPAFACAACYGKSDSALASGMNWGILTLLGFVLTVLTCLVVFFVHLARRSPAEDDPADRPPPAA